MSMEESVSVSMQDFAYKPKERLPTVSWYYTDMLDFDSQVQILE